MTVHDATAKQSRRRSFWQRCLTPWRRDEGQAAFEFILILPFFVLFLLLLIDFGIVMYEYVSISNGARDAARYASANCGDGGCTLDEVRIRAAERSGGILNSADPLDLAKIDVSWPLGTDRGDAVSVAIDHPYEFLFFPATIPVVTCVDMRLERDDSSAVTGGSSC